LPFKKEPKHGEAIILIPENTRGAPRGKGQTAPTSGDCNKKVAPGIVATIIVHKKN